MERGVVETVLSQFLFFEWLKKQNQWMAKYESSGWIIIFFSVSVSQLILKKEILTGIYAWHECVISQHMTQTWEPALTGEDKKNTSTTALNFIGKPRRLITEGSRNKSLHVWQQAQYDSPLGG